MQAITDDEMLDYLSRLVDLRCQQKRVEFTSSQSKTITIDLRLPEPHQLVFVARLAASLLDGERAFGGAFFWVTQWGVWDPNVEAIGFNTLERYRQGFAENRSLTAAPGHLFRHDEFVDSVACLVQPMLVGWDAYYIPQPPKVRLEFFLFVSHDSFLDIETRTNESYEKAMEVLKGFSWIKVRDVSPTINS